MQSIPSALTKTYPRRGPLQQHRFAEALAFRCFRCGASKKSKLITVYNGDWSTRLCNGCYGRLLSIYEIKAKSAPDDQRAEELAVALLSIVSEDNRRKAERILLASQTQASRLSRESLRFIATSEHLAKELSEEPDLEWSPAVIGLCKAVEIEVVRSILTPLATLAKLRDLTLDRKDKDIGRVATFCADPSGKPPELGAFTHFLQTVIHSRDRRETSETIKSFLGLARDWTGSQWVLDPTGFSRELSDLTTRFRNRAAHIDELGKHDYDICREAVIGAHGILWKFVLSVERHR